MIEEWQNGDISVNRFRIELVELFRDFFKAVKKPLKPPQDTKDRKNVQSDASASAAGKTGVDGAAEVPAGKQPGVHNVKYEPPSPAALGVGTQKESVFIKYVLRTVHWRVILERRLNIRMCAMRY